MWSETPVIGQDRSETKKSVLVLQVWCCVVKHGLVTLVVIMISKDTATFSSTFIVSLFWVLELWRSTVVFTYLKVKSAKNLFTSGGLGLVILVLVL